MILRIFPGGVFTSQRDNRTFVVVSNSDIEQDILSGAADFALLGSDKYNEITNTQFLRFEPVGKLACQFVFALPDDQDRLPERKLRTATSYPKAFAKFIAETGVNATLGPIRSGKVEGTIQQGIADAIFDIRETGESLTANNLRVEEEGDYIELGGFWYDGSKV